jgi:hypothetical protein
MTSEEKKNLIESLRIISNTEDVELIKLMIDSIIEKLEDSYVDNDTYSDNKITL